MKKTRSTVSVPPPPFHRRTIGRYEIVYPLASGGMASVYVARLAGMAGFEKIVAIKMIHPHLATEKEFIDMFIDEASLTARVHHPNVAEVYEIGEDDGLLFIACEFVNGRSLRQVIKAAMNQHRPISHTVAARICAQVCAGLHAAHELAGDDGQPMNLVHRDVSPNNVLVSFDGQVKLIDFGVAFATDRNSHTATGVLKGKYGFIAPEVLRGDSFDRRADIFSTGVMFYILATGQHPFDADTDIEKIRKSMESEFIPPSQVSKSVGPELESIILKAMQADPKKRFETAAEMGRFLLNYAATLRKDGGTAIIEQTMKSLFADKAGDHSQKVRDFKDSIAESTDNGGLTNPGVNVSGREGRSASDSQKEGRKGPTPLGRSSRIAQSGSDPGPVINSRGEFVTEDGYTTEPFRAALAKKKKGRTGAASRWARVGVIGGVAVLSVILFVVFSGREPTEIFSIEESDVVGAGKQSRIVLSYNTGLEKSRPQFRYTKNDRADETHIAVPCHISPRSARVKLDGVRVKVKNNVLLLPNDQKEHMISATAPRYLSATRSVVADHHLSLRIELVRAKKKRKKSAARKKRTKKSRRADERRLSEDGQSTEDQPGWLQRFRERRQKRAAKQEK